jgi:hypothetical protein
MDSLTELEVGVERTWRNLVEYGAIEAGFQDSIGR